MTILIINYHPEDMVGGSEIQCDLIAKALTRRGHRVVYMAVDGRQAAYHSPYHVEPSPISFAALRTIMRLHRPDIVFWRFSKRKFFFSAVVFRLLKAKVVFSVCNMYDVIKWGHKLPAPGSLTFKQRLRHSLTIFRELMYSRYNYCGFYFVDGVIAQSQQQTRKTPVKHERVIYNSATDRAVPFTWNAPFVIWVSSLKKRKNIEAFLTLAEHFQERGIDFLIVGQVQSAQYAYLNDNPHPTPNVYYLGKKTYDEVNGMIKESLFLAHTSYGPEGFPNVFIQAWMQAKPALSLFCDPDELIARNRLGRVSHTIQQFIADAKELVDSPALREEIGQHALRFANEHFNLEKNAASMEAFFNDILKN